MVIREPGLPVFGAVSRVVTIGEVPGDAGGDDPGDMGGESTGETLGLPITKAQDLDPSFFLAARKGFWLEGGLKGL